MQKMPKAWVVSWVYCGSDELLLERYGIKNQIIDILGPRVHFEKLGNLAEDYYIRHILSLTERIQFQHYRYGFARKRESLKLVPVWSSYHSDTYKRVMMEHPTKEDLNAWIAYPKYYGIGHNPAIEIFEVSNLLWQRENGKVKLEWYRPKADGSNEHCEYEFES